MSQCLSNMPTDSCTGPLPSSCPAEQPVPGAHRLWDSSWYLVGVCVCGGIQVHNQAWGFLLYRAVTPTWVFRKADGQGRLLNLLAKEVFLVEEENDGGIDEKLVVTDGVEEHERLVHAVLQPREGEGREQDRDTQRDREEKKRIRCKERLGCPAPRRPWAPGSSMRSVYKAWSWKCITVHLMLACQAPTVPGQWETGLGASCGSLGEAEVRSPRIRMAEPPAL